MDVDALTPARLSDRQRLLLWCPAASGPHRMGRMHRVRKQHGLAIGQGIQEIIVFRDEVLLLLFVELARDQVRLVIFEPQTMQ